jgi:acetyl esterase/lipase
MLPAAHIDALNEAGFVAVTSDYRLCPTISVLDGPVADTIAAYTWAQDELPTLLEKEHGIRVSGKNIVTLGHSCGGGLALLMVSMSYAKTEKSWLLMRSCATGVSPSSAQSCPGFIRIQISAR